MRVTSTFRLAKHAGAGISRFEMEDRRMNDHEGGG